MYILCLFVLYIVFLYLYVCIYRYIRWMIRIDKGYTDLSFRYAVVSKWLDSWTPVFLRSPKWYSNLDRPFLGWFVLVFFLRWGSKLELPKQCRFEILILGDRSLERNSEFPMSFVLVSWYCSPPHLSLPTIDCVHWAFLGGHWNASRKSQSHKWAKRSHFWRIPPFLVLPF